MTAGGNDGVNIQTTVSAPRTEYANADHTERPAERPAERPIERPIELAVMCDLDGTLVDTERSWLDAVRHSIRELGFEIDDATLLQYEGATLEQASSRIIAAYEVSRSAAEIAELLEDTTLAALEDNIAWRPGAEAMLRSLAGAGVPLALVTSSTRRWVDTVARHVDLAMFAHFVTADDVTATKPDPAPYLRGAELLGAAPERCVVFEDSRVGTEAALAAGCVSVLVQPTTEAWAEYVHATAPTFSGIDYAWVSGALKLARD